ncbi:MAG: glycosyltransferase [Solobacterium sp.]|nr:glycosyltransferase [Solobacterium sp.]
MEKKIAVLIPCYNEELTVAKTVRDFKTVLPEAVIYVYDNNSTDKTAELAKEAGAVVRKETHQGKGNVVRTMFREIDADAYVLVDGDDTYPAEEVQKLLEPVLEGNADMVIGDRLSNGTYYSENKRAFHEFGNNLVRDLINRLFHGSIKDIMTGYRVFSRRFVKCMPVRSEGFQIETEMTVFSLIMRLNVVELPITYRDRPEGSFSKLNTYKDGWKVLVTLFDLYKNYRPFYFFFLIFVLLLIIGIPLAVAGHSFAGAILILSAVVLLAAGIVLDSIKNQTLQILEEVLNNYELNNK